MNWEEKDQTLQKEFLFRDFSEAIAFVNKVAELSERLNHHPDIFLYAYKRVRITTTTHSEGKLTEKDHELADGIDRL